MLQPGAAPREIKLKELVALKGRFQEYVVVKTSPWHMLWTSICLSPFKGRIMKK